MSDTVAFTLVEEDEGVKLMKGEEVVSTADTKEEIVELLNEEFGEDEYEFTKPEQDPAEPDEAGKKPDEASDPEAVVPDADPEPVNVPVQALQDERNKRQAYESVVKAEMDALKAEVAELKASPKEPTDADVYAEEHAGDPVSVGDFQKAMRTMATNFASVMEQQQGLQQADVLMEQLKHGQDIAGLGMSMKEIVETAAPILNSNPEVKAKLASMANPTYELYMIANAQRMAKSFGMDTIPGVVPVSGTVPIETPVTPPAVVPTKTQGTAEMIAEAAALRTQAAINNQENLSPSQGEIGDKGGSLATPVEAAIAKLTAIADQSEYHAEYLRLKKESPALLAAMEAVMDEE